MRGAISTAPTWSARGFSCFPHSSPWASISPTRCSRRSAFRLTDRVPGGGSDFVGLANYTQMASEPKFWEALKNNMLWLIVVPALSTAFGLLAAQLSDRISWGNIAKSLIFMPMAISFVGAAVIFKLVYDTRPEGQDQIGVLNAVWMSFEDNWLAGSCASRSCPLVILVVVACDHRLCDLPADRARPARTSVRANSPWRSRPSCGLVGRGSSGNLLSA